MAEQEQTVDQQQEKAREKAEDDRYQRAEQQQAAYDDEYESRRETLSALALFQQDAVEQLAGGSRQNRRDYYQKLLSRLYIELRDLGASMLLDQLDAQLTQKHQGKCAMLVYSAVTQCYQMLVLDAPMADAANAVPDVFTAEREPMTWELLASYSADPELPVRASSLNPNFTITVGLCIANSLTALSGAIVGQYQKTVDINSGTGIVVIGLACLIIGETLLGRRTVTKGVIAVILGSIVYRFIYAIVFYTKVVPVECLKLLTAVIVALAIAAPSIKKWAAFQHRKLAAQRRGGN